MRFPCSLLRVRPCRPAWRLLPPPCPGHQERCHPSWGGRFWGGRAESSGSSCPIPRPRLRLLEGRRGSLSWMFGAPSPLGHVPWPWRCRAHRPICTWSRFRRSWPCRCRPSDVPASFLRAQPHRLRLRPVLCSRNQPAARRGAGTARAVGPVQLPPKHQTQVPHSCAKLRLGPQAAFLLSCLWPQGLLGPRSWFLGAPRGPCGNRGADGWCCPRRPRPLRVTPRSDPRPQGRP